MRTRGMLVLGLLATVAAGAQSWTIPPREVPPPAGASEALRESIGGQPRADASALPQAPTSLDEWRQQVAAADAARTEMIDARLDASTVTITADSIAGVPVHRLRPERVADAFADRLYIDLHGGAYVYGNGRAGLAEALVVAERIGIPVVAVDYSMPPFDRGFPAAVDDAVAVYLALLDSYEPERVAVGGTSAGGGLTLAMVQRLKAIGAPLPAALYAGTPWADLTKTGDSLYTNEGIDRVLVAYEGGLAAAARLYAGVESLRHPLLSPVYGDFNGFPPALLTSGTRDLFLSDVVRTHRKLRAAGVVADLHVYEAMSHAGYLIWTDTPESASLYEELRLFLEKHLGPQAP